MNNIDITNEDCMNLMARYPDKHFDLAITDPPYGIGKVWKKDVLSTFYHHKGNHKNETAPGQDYFDELFRVSKKTIIWGANYFTRYLPPRNSWIVWDKCKNERGLDSACELAWTNFNIPLKKATFAWDGFNTCCERYGKHPHEKPVLLYSWILAGYAQPGWKILDTHLGSGSLAIACCDAEFGLTACEINKQYFDDATDRIKKHQQHQFLFHRKELQGCAATPFEEEQQSESEYL
jgi:site-specific DNA-methyltransferase (adenine-specific)